MIAGNPNFSSTVDLSGVGSRWNSSTYGIGDGTLSTGTGTVFVRNGAALSVTNQLWIGERGTLQIQNGGLLRVGGGTVNSGTLHLQSGSQSQFAGVITLSDGGIFRIETCAVASGITSVAGPGTFINNSTVGIDFTAGNGTTLKGNGAIQGTVTIQPGGTISPGNSIGTLTLQIDSWMFDNTAHGGGPGADWNYFDPQQSYSWKWIEADNIVLTGVDSIDSRFFIVDEGLNSGVFGTGNPYSRFGVSFFDVSRIGNALYLNYHSAVPEPGSMILAGLAALGGFVRYRRRNANAAAVESSVVTDVS